MPSAPSAGIIWEAFKAFTRGHIIQHASFKKETSITKQLELEKKVNIAENVFKHNTSSTNSITITRLKYELNATLTHKAEFALFRARQKFFEEEDKAGRMLATYIKEEEALRSIPALQGSGRRAVTDPGEINGAFRDFYIKLYSSESQADKQELDAFLTTLGLPTLSGNQVNSLHQPITVEEIAEVIRNLPSSKALRPDGFTAEFYKAYVDKLSPLLLDMYSEAADMGGYLPLCLMPSFP